MCIHKKKNIILLLLTAASVWCIAVSAEAVVFGNADAGTDYLDSLSVPQNDSHGVNLMDAYGTATTSATTANATTPEYGSSASRVEMLDSTSPGIIGAKSKILSGVNLPKEITTGARANAESNWTVLSATLATGSGVQFALTAHFEGLLSAVSTYTGASSQAIASGGWEYGTGIFSHADEGYGSITLKSDGLYKRELDWLTWGSLSATANPDIYSWTVDVPILVSTKVGDNLRLRISLDSRCLAYGPSTGSYQASALSDFYNTGFFTGIPLTGNTYLVRADSTTPNTVPEPGTLLGFGLPMLMIGLNKLRGLRK